MRKNEKLYALEKNFVKMAYIVCCFHVTFGKKCIFQNVPHLHTALHFTVEIAEKNSPTKQIFREINCLVISLVKTVKKLVFRNLSHKSARSREKFCHFHTHSVEKQEIHCNAIFFPSNQFRVNYC